MTLPDHYQMLGITERATLDEVRRAYRNQARLWHPDRQGDSPEAAMRFKMISEAHTVLTDPEQRSAYNETLRPRTPPPSPGPHPSAANRFGQFVGNVFYQFKGKQSEAAKDLEAEVSIPFLVAVRGGLQTLTLKRDLTCERCHGSGAEPGTASTACPTCQGHGDIHIERRGKREIQRCQVCMGRGTLPRILCRRCHGHTKVAAERTITVKIPPNVRSGVRLKIANEGEAHHDGSSRGDLLVTVQVEPHPRWRVVGLDVHENVEIDIALAVLGGSLPVTTIDGPTSVQVAAGTRHGTLLKLKSHGMKDLQEPGLRGEHLLHVAVRIPSDLSADARKKFIRFAQAAGLNVPMP